VRGRRRNWWTLGTVLAYALPAALVWLVIGWALASLGVPALGRALAVAYAALFGVAEALWLPVHAPSSQWGVPARWVRRHGLGTRTVIWGALLGPGLVTKNPYAGMWLLPLILLSITGGASGAAVGAAVGIAHGSMRALGVRDNARRASNPHTLLMRMLYWRFADGLAAVFAGAAIATLIV
jgi:hypothetical protein